MNYLFFSVSLSKELVETIAATTGVMPRSRTLNRILSTIGHKGCLTYSHHRVALALPVTERPLALPPRTLGGVVVHNNRYDNFVYIGSLIAGGLSMVIMVFLFLGVVQ